MGFAIIGGNEKRIIGLFKKLKHDFAKYSMFVDV
jgi:hypothetical protein